MRACLLLLLLPLLQPLQGEARDGARAGQILELRGRDLGEPASLPSAAGVGTGAGTVPPVPCFGLGGSAGIASFGCFPVEVFRPSRLPGLGGVLRPPDRGAATTPGPTGGPESGLGPRGISR